MPGQEDLSPCTITQTFDGKQSAKNTQKAVSGDGEASPAVKSTGKEARNSSVLLPPEATFSGKAQEVIISPTGDGAGIVISRNNSRSADLEKVNSGKPQGPLPTQIIINTSKGSPRASQE